LEAERQVTAQVKTLQQESKPDLPVTVSFRRAILGGGLVARFRNNTALQLEIAALFISPSTGQRSQTQLVLGPGQTQEVGSLQGWQFIAGQQIQLSNTGFRPIVISVPGGNAATASGADEQLRNACPIIVSTDCASQTGPALRTCIEQNRSKYANLSTDCTRLLGD
jgi:hypothetical protein